MAVLTSSPRRQPHVSSFAPDPAHSEAIASVGSGSVGTGDEDLLRRVARGEEAALRDLFTLYGPYAKALAQRIVTSPVLAEEVVQEVFLAVWRHAGDYHPELGSVRSWLFAAVHNRAVDSVRREEAFRRRAQEEAVLIPEAGEPDVAEVVTENEDLADRRKRTRAALELLPDEQRVVVELMYFEGRTQAAIARETGVPLGTVKSRSLLAMRRLRRELERTDVEVDR